LLARSCRRAHFPKPSERHCDLTRDRHHRQSRFLILGLA
jgi:hypothetical protein